MQHSAEGQATPRHLPTFSCPHGPTPRTKQATMPLQTFQLLLIKVILEKNSFCYEELLPFIGITIVMGLLKQLHIPDYWSKEQMLATPWFPAIMSRDRYFLIL